MAYERLLATKHFCATLQHIFVHREPTKLREQHMNISKVFALSIALCASIASAQYGLLTVSFGTHALQVPVEYSETTQVFVNHEQTFKVECVQENGEFQFEVSVKNEAGEWEVVSKPTLKLENEVAELTIGSSSNEDLIVKLETVKE